MLMNDQPRNHSGKARIPFRLERSTRLPSFSTGPVIALVAVLGLIIGFELVQVFLPPPASGEIRTTCNLRRVTGIPCPGCGGTRAVKAAFRLDPVGALRHNPFVSSVLLVAVVVLLVRLLSGYALRLDLSGTGWVLVAVLVVVLLLANWWWVLRQHGFLLGE